jgi:hypothetical protein
MMDDPTKETFRALLRAGYTPAQLARIPSDMAEWMVAQGCRPNTRSARRELLERQAQELAEERARIYFDPPSAT